MPPCFVFDFNDPLLTNLWSNTLDNDKPASKVKHLQPLQFNANFPVVWSGTDVGSGLQDFTIYVSEDGGPYTAWLTNTTDTQATFTGDPVN